ncbi:hypothetical protein GTZ99_01180 [Novosphingobium sp. FSY-8]|uniref:Uncharacterized protein n=1 Tax=Novosphingobium ovatum TaxID=1908523 RepID=A0ABW9X9G7_9SPHN|nr:DUF6628 family protein [Novosphingobium ovatum]NBC35167.1 hypothetical protein [Novosphingobium ovatum]
MTTPNTNPLTRILPHEAPPCDATRRLLIAARRMAIHGVYDAQAAMLLFCCHGLQFRRSLVLLRALMLDVSAAARAPIQIAPCCVGRMTAHEHALITAIATAGRDTPRAMEALDRLTGGGDSGGLLATTMVLADALRQAGHPAMVD